MRIPATAGYDFETEPLAVGCEIHFYPGQLLLYFRARPFTKASMAVHAPPIVRITTWDLPPWRNSVLYVETEHHSSFRCRLTVAKRKLVEEGIAASGLILDVGHGGLRSQNRNHNYPR
jgi:hypothetical protein